MCGRRHEDSTNVVAAALRDVMLCDEMKNREMTANQYVTKGTVSSRHRQNDGVVDLTDEEEAPYKPRYRPTKRSMALYASHLDDRANEAALREMVKAVKVVEKKLAEAPDQRCCFAPKSPPRFDSSG